MYSGSLITVTETKMEVWAKCQTLITKYETKAGRPVFDGGINPDVETDQRQLSEVAFNLGLKMLYFDFATEYFHKNPTVAPVKEFVITDEVYDEFKLWLEDKEFDYTTDSEKMMERLKKVAEEEQYFERIEKPNTAC